MAVQFFYDQQIRRFLLQFIRMVSNFQVEFGSINPATGAPALQTVPVFYGDASRQASQILRNNSENYLRSVPAMAVYITGLQYDRNRMQEPFFVSKLNIRQRMMDPVTGLPTNQQGDSYTVERAMPVPYLMTLKLDIWTSNTEQKLQIVEQIATLFNPSLEIQSTDNYIDWTSLSVVLLTDVSWDARSVPVGTEDPLSIATMTFELPIWISPPAKLKRLGVVQKIIASVFDAGGEGAVLADALGDPEKLLTRRAINVLHYSILYTGNTLQLIKYNEIVAQNQLDSNQVQQEITRAGTPDAWDGLINEYGVMHNGISEIRLIQPSGHVIVGTIAFHPSDPTLMLFDPFPATLPANTLRPVNAIFDPLKMDVDKYLIDSVTGEYKVETGTRYMILNPIDSVTNTEFASAWTANGNTLIANANDIIEFDGNRWRVSFDSQRHIDEQYVTNLNTGVQFKWTGEMWIKSYEGLYREGDWTIVL